ncbi:MAG: hypothetical protein GY717_04480 [Rhodobacteraceae bacterium]|nr:hypothetical protein [Paracoccaceae bacterium]
MIDLHLAPQQYALSLGAGEFRAPCPAEAGRQAVPTASGPEKNYAKSCEFLGNTLGRPRPDGLIGAGLTALLGFVPRRYGKGDGSDFAMVTGFDGD